MNKRFIGIIFFMSLGIMIFGLGFIIGEYYGVINGLLDLKEYQGKIYDGCWVDVKEYLNNSEGNIVAEVDTADWVCVNIMGMTYERCLEVVAHECGHELFAEKCEHNPELCFNLIKELENETTRK